jgi:hypothetical protein
LEYDEPLVPEGNDVVVIAKTGGVMARERVAVWVCGVLEESVTWKVRLVVPLVAVLPEMTPVDVLRLMPDGNEPLVRDQL